MRIRVRIEHFRADADPVQDKRFWLIILRKKYIFLIEKYNLFIPMSPYRKSKGQEKPSALTKEHPVLQKMNFFYFFHIFAGHFSILHPDAQHWIKQKGTGKALNRDHINFYINMYTYLKTYLFVYSITYLAVQSASRIPTEPWYLRKFSIFCTYQKFKTNTRSRQVGEIHYVCCTNFTQ